MPSTSSIEDNKKSLATSITTDSQVDKPLHYPLIGKQLVTEFGDPRMSEIKVTPLLGVQEVEKSSTLVKIGGKNVILDCGLNLSALNDDDGINGDQLLPDFSFLFGTNAVPTSIDCVIISHYHLEHSGALPYLTEKLGYKGPIYMTQPTKTIAPFVWRDCHKTLKVKNFFPDFLSSTHIADCMAKVTTVTYSEVISVDNGITVTVFPSNQPLGPDIFHLEVGQQSIFYTGGCNLKPYSRPPIIPSSLNSKANESNIPDDVSSNVSSSSIPNQQSDITVKMNGCMLSFKIGHSVFHRQINPQEMQLITAVFNNLQFMDEANEDEFWQRIAYEMTMFSSPLNDESKQKWKTLFYDSLRSCNQKTSETLEDGEISQNGLNGHEDFSSEMANKTPGKKNRKNKKAKKLIVARSSDDLIKFDSPEADIPRSQLKVSEKQRYSPDIQITPKKQTVTQVIKHNSDGGHQITPRKSPVDQHYEPDPVILNEQILLIETFAQRLKVNKISDEFWVLLNRDLKMKGKIPKDLEEYFKKLAKIQMEIMDNSENFIDAAAKWPLFALLNDLDLSYFFEDKWVYRRLKSRFLDTNPTPKSKGKKSKNKNKQEANNQVTFSPNIQETSDEGDQSEPPNITYSIDPEDLADSVITITLFSSRLKKTKMGPEFWTHLRKDFETIGKPLRDEVDIVGHYKSLAEIQLNVMKASPDIATAIQKWPLFMMLHDLPLDTFLDDKWAYRRLKPNFN